MKRVLPLLALLLATSAQGQTAAKLQEETTLTIKPIEPKVTVQQLETHIDKNMATMTSLVEAMSNNLGQLHYLRTLCFGDNDQKWRAMASDMLRIEAPKNASYQRQLIRAFNAGYYAQKDNYTSCTSTVALNVAALSENGRHLATMLGDPYRER